MKRVFSFALTLCATIALPSIASPRAYAQEGVPVFTPFTVPPAVKNAEALKARAAELYRQLPALAPEAKPTRIWFRVDARGAVRAIQLKESSGDRRVDSIAFVLARLFEFEPALNNTTPVAVWVDIPIVLRPESNPRQAPGDLLLEGGRIFDSVRDTAYANPGILLRGGKIYQIGGTFDRAGMQVVTLAADDHVLPGFFDLHAHYAVDFFGGSRVDETTVYPTLFLANGVTSTFPAGEMQPQRMRDLRWRIETGREAGPRIYNSGPYFGTARPGWSQDITADSIRAEVDFWVSMGALGFKAKGIRPEHLKPLIERAHVHGLTVTGHLDSGFRNSVNPRDAILMGIDRIEHFLGGDAITADKPAYSSVVTFTPDMPEFARIAKLYIDHRVNFDATRSAYGYYGKRDPAVYAYWTDEKRFLTPYMRGIIESRAPRQVSEQFEQIYWAKAKTIKAFYDAGGGHLITLGTDHPSWGEFFSGFSVHRELHALSLTGIPNSAVLKIATINGARALRVGDRLGTIEVGKLADLVVVRGNPLSDIRNTRNVRHVIKAGSLFDPAALLRSVEGRLGPSATTEESLWGKRPNE